MQILNRDAPTRVFYGLSRRPTEQPPEEDYGYDSKESCSDTDSVTKAEPHSRNAEGFLNDPKLYRNETRGTKSKLNVRKQKVPALEVIPASCRSTKEQIIAFHKCQNELKHLRKRLQGSEDRERKYARELEYVQQENDNLLDVIQDMDIENTNLKRDIGFLRKTESNESRLATEHHQQSVLIHRLKNENKRLVNLYDGELLKLKSLVNANLGKNKCEIPESNTRATGEPGNACDVTKLVNAKDKQIEQLKHMKKYRDLKKAKRVLEEENKNMCSKLSHETKARMTSEEAYASLKADYITDMKERRHTISKLKSDLRKSRKANHETQDQTASFKENIQQQEDGYRRLTLELEETKKRETTLEQDKTSLSKKVKKLGKELEITIQRETATQSRLTEWETDIQQAKLKETHLLQEIETAKELNKTLDEYTHLPASDRSSKIEPNVAEQLNQRIVEQEQINKDFHKKYEQCKRQLTEEKDMSERNKQLQKRNDALQIEINSLENKVSEMSQNLEVERPKFIEQAHKNTSELDEVKTSLKRHHNEKILHIENENKGLQKENEVLNKTIQTIEISNGVKETELIGLRQELDDAKTR